ncbi:hypothetical protein HYV87_03775 [Candidatus Woesearchaeota archaeon]|nr:hypothetical protein [Candidatus Woesearchaeota archaeon]
MQDLIARLKGLQVVHHGEVQLSHGGISNLYFDFKQKAYGDAEAFYLINKYLGQQIPNRVNCIAGGGYGGIPLATGLSLMFWRNQTLVRDQPKEHGIKRIFEGYTPQEADKVAIVDDVFTTGRSLQKVVDLIVPTGAEIIGCYVILKRGEGELSITRGEEKIPVPVESLLRVEDLL